MAAHLPVDEVLPELEAALIDNAVVIIEAPPGTGKTTRVPPFLIGIRQFDGKKVIILEPRRVAARAAAQRMADERGEKIGRTIGLRTRFDTRVGRHTRVEVVTEGVLTRMLLDDPSLSGVGAVVFDEFHERSIHADTALVFALETLDALRPDLRLIVMSATLDSEALSTGLGTDSVIRAEGQTHPVSTIYRPPAPGRDAEAEVPDAVVAALDRHPGDVLVFLAGARDISRAQRELKRRLGDEIVITPLHGMLPPVQQDLALQPDPAGHRKVILSTPLAETSVTIDGVRVVVDTGRRRRPEMDHGRGMSRLRTVSTSQASTDQRRGRAGRQEAGACVRLWSESDQSRRPRHDPPEILTSDLTDMALQIAAWGVVDHTELRWLDPPPTAALDSARETLTALGAIDEDRRITEHGRSMMRLGTEPRLAHLMLVGSNLGQSATACDVAAVLSDRDLLVGRDRPTDLRARVEALHAGGPGVDRSARSRARDSSRRWRRAFDVVDEPFDLDLVGPLISQAFPNRIAMRRKEPGGFLLTSGAGATMPADDGLAREPFLAVAELQGAGPDAIIRTAAPVSLEEIRSLHGERIEHAVRGGWDRRARDVVFEDQQTLGSLILVSGRVPDPPLQEVTEALLAGVRREGLAILGWNQADQRYRSRLAFAHSNFPDEWPDVSDESLMERLDDWVTPQLGNAKRRSDLEALDVKGALGSLIDWRQRRDLDRLAPSHIDVPSGSRIPVDYMGPAPVLPVRLQEMFGMTESPTVAGGAVRVVLHLLSPAHRPVQVTDDLASFWETGYAEVRRELRGRYPKHSWPEDPTSAAPTARTKKRG